MNTPATQTDRVREALREWMELPESFPLVVPSSDMQPRLEEEAKKWGQRKYEREPVQHSAFAQLQEE